MIANNKTMVKLFSTIEQSEIIKKKSRELGCSISELINNSLITWGEENSNIPSIGELKDGPSTSFSGLNVWVSPQAKEAYDRLFVKIISEFFQELGLTR